MGRRFRWRGSTPRIEEVAERAWEHSLCQFTVARLHDLADLGVCVVSSPDFTNGYAYVSVMMLPEGRGYGVGLEGFALLVDHAFRTWPFRKLYAEVLEESFDQFDGAVRAGLVEVEGRRKADQFVDGRYQDLLTLAIYRERWAEDHPILRWAGLR